MPAAASSLTSLCASESALVSQELEHKFEEFGKVREARVVRNPATGESRGFGFVALDHDDEVDDVSA